MEDLSSQDYYWQFVLLVVLTFLNAFFSATEMAMVSLVVHVLNKGQQGDKRYIRLPKVLENSKSLLSTISSWYYFNYNLVRGLQTSWTIGSIMQME